jgi:hypothetical protein
MVCYINGDLYTGATGNTTAKWDLIIDKYLDNAADYLNDADIHGYTNNYCEQPVRCPGLLNLGIGLLTLLRTPVWAAWGAVDLSGDWRRSDLLAHRARAKVQFFAATG